MKSNFLNCNLSKMWFLEDVVPVAEHLKTENLKACGVNRVADYHNAQLARVRSAYSNCKGSDTDEVKEKVIKLFDEMHKLKRKTKECKEENTSARGVSKKTRRKALKHNRKTKRKVKKDHKKHSSRKSTTSKRR